MLGESFEFVNEPFRMDPAQSMKSNIKLPGIIADADTMAQEAMRHDAAPQRPFGGDTDGVGCDLEVSEAEVLKPIFNTSPAGIGCR